MTENWKKFETKDYQNRKGRYPDSDMADYIWVYAGRADITFCNTESKVAIAWVEQFVKENHLPSIQISAKEHGDCHGD